MTPREVLLKAAALVERGWTQHEMARDRVGNKVSPISDTAVCWCALGAAKRVADGHTHPYSHARDALYAHLFAHPDSGDGPDPVTTWNDAPGRTQAEVVAALKAAAETCA